MRKSILFIFNPHSGKKKIKNFLSSIIEKISTDNNQLIVVPTKRAGDAEVIVGDYKDDPISMICCSGGDGTLHEVVNGLMKNDVHVPVCYIPAGSTNDFGESLHVPKDMVKAAISARAGVPFPIDIGTFNDNYFVYTACFGVFTKTSYATPQGLKNALGHFAYIVNGTREFMSIKKYYMRVEYDGKVVEDYFIFGSVTSSESVGGFKGIAGKPIFNDGMFELILIKDGKASELPGLIAAMLKGNMKHDRIIYARVKDVKFTSAYDVAWCMDGEFAGDLSSVNISINKEAVSLMIPKEAEKLISSEENVKKTSSAE